MKILAGILILAACLQPYTVSGDAATAASDNDEVPASVSDTAVATATATAEATSLSTGCPISCNCPFIYRPVCGTDCRTYSNDCVLRCISASNVAHGLSPIGIKSQGECPRYTCNCPRIYDPVCGTDGNTYANICLLRCEDSRHRLINLPRIKVKHNGVCKTPYCFYSDIKIPVCGTDNLTYRNIGILNCINCYNQAHGLPQIYVQYYGPCKKENCICPAVVDPVCASDGLTYENECLLACENRRRDHVCLPSLSVAYKGTCFDCICPAVYDPVCGSNGVTYGNICLFKCENIRRASLKPPLKPLTVSNSGVCSCVCSLEYDPVCASDNATYNNLCLLRCENKKREDLGWPLLTIDHSGQCECCCDYCPGYYMPVCGNDGRTYLNMCWLDCYKNCNNNCHPLFLAHKGPC